MLGNGPAWFGGGPHRKRSSPTEPPRRAAYPVSYLIVHHAISDLIAQASNAADLDPDRISFAKALRLIRRSAIGTADIPPSRLV